MNKKILFRQFYWTSLFLLLTVVLPIKTALSQPVQECNLRQEIFGFELNDYPIKHQGFAITQLKVDYRYIDTEKIDPTIYHNFIPMVEAIDKFLKNYPNDRDSWETVNRKLSQFLLDQYPTVASIRISIQVEHGSGNQLYNRHSIVILTRPGACPLTDQTILGLIPK
jgi:hypothetical protein